MSNIKKARAAAGQARAYIDKPWPRILYPLREQAVHLLTRLHDLGSNLVQQALQQGFV